MTFLHFSREFEAQADFLGVQYMYRAGYDPQAFISFFEKIQALESASREWFRRPSPTIRRHRTGFSIRKRRLPGFCRARPVHGDHFRVRRIKAGWRASRTSAVWRLEEHKKPSLRRASTGRTTPRGPARHRQRIDRRRPADTASPGRPDQLTIPDWQMARTLSARQRGFGLYSMHVRATLVAGDTLPGIVFRHEKDCHLCGCVYVHSVVDEDRQPDAQRPAAGSTFS